MTNFTASATGSQGPNAAVYIEVIATAIFDKPTSRTPRQLRYGTHGSLALDIAGPKAGLFFDFETGKGGDIIDLVKRELNVDFVAAVTFCERVTGGVVSSRPAPIRPITPSPTQKELDDDQANRIGLALDIWKQTVPLNETLGEQYLKRERKLDVRCLALDHALRWHEHKRLVVGLMRSPLTGEPTGVQRIFLTETGTKIKRWMLGKKGVVCLTPYEDVTDGLGIVEGIECGLTLLVIGQGPIWCAMDAGSVGNFPIIPGIESLTIFADNDDPGIRGANDCQQTWVADGREARIIYPPGGPA